VWCFALKRHDSFNMFHQEPLLIINLPKGLFIFEPNQLNY
jgi:hypothetical protein